MNVIKFGLYAITQKLEKGVALIVFDVGEQISGVKLGVGKSEKFSLKRTDFENMVSHGLLEYIQLLPKTVWKQYKAVYNK